MGKGKRYYCDFCERSFADNAENRKTHLNGVQHQRLKKLHYDTFRDAATILAEDSLKKPCKRYHQTGQCNFGAECRFSHLTQDDIYRLREQANQERYRKSRKFLASPLDGQSMLNSWLSKRAEKLASVNNAPTSTAASQPTLNWTLPQPLQTAVTLPPSILPPSVLDFTAENLSAWV